LRLGASEVLKNPWLKDMAEKVH